ncbi:DUF2326 domain-containing protein [Mycoplasma yeatsii]|uniref:DUF2326 domain-containing protein n=1 Tax=Mycoplasma yeatsii TaxID=51365 RepID=UPI0005B24F3F|nr:DUF2326 domain-containing protein [Mycoplasma yeatsii]AJM72049.1 hypothetical protein MYE_02905 [Mycoplasma yeatsii GM274B]
MFIKSLTISTDKEVIRKLEFKKGLNLIVDNTPESDKTKTGNDVGKTTVLKLINFCLGGKEDEIYKSLESKTINEKVQNFLIEKKVLIKLHLVDDLNDPESKSIIIERNFLKKDKNITIVNGEKIKDKILSEKLLSLIFPDHKANKPSFREIISHNIRYKEQSINNTLKTVHSSFKDRDYEFLHLFLFGYSFAEYDDLSKLTKEIEIEKKYKAKLNQKEKNAEKAYQSSLDYINARIKDLKYKKDNLNINENFENDLSNLNNIKYEISKYTSYITRVKLRKRSIDDFIDKMKKDKFSIDSKQLSDIYHQTKKFIPNLHKSFDALVKFHNSMIDEKVKFIYNELSKIELEIIKYETKLNQYLKEEKELSIKISKYDTFEELDDIISQLNDMHTQKGEYETKIKEIKDTEEKINSLENRIKNIGKSIYSEEFATELDKRIKKFNTFFSDISKKLYNEAYILTSNNEMTKNNLPIYKFYIHAVNHSSGKKQGEIVCYDLAYIEFADSENMKCLHFLLNDKKELMADNQLTVVSEYLLDKNAQLILSVLKDKMPNEALRNANIVVELSQEEKLFKI